MLNMNLSYFAHLRMANACAVLIASVLLAPAAHGQSTTRVVSSDPSLGKPVAPPLAPEKASSAPKRAPAPPQPLTPPSYLSSLETTNGFDPQRKMWPDKVPPPPPPAPPPLPPFVTDQDLQLYGVVIVGQTKRATIKVGTRFSQIDTAGRSFVSVSEGQALGEWVLAEIHPTHLVLSSPGGQQTVNFNKKTDRVASANVQAVQPVAVNEPTPNAPVPATTSAQVADASTNRTPVSPVPASASASPAVAGPSVTEIPIKNAQPGSLAAAIAAAQAAATQNASQAPANVPPPANFNPFLQLFPKQ